MKVFVSGQLQEKRRIRDVFDMLSRHGHPVTHDWTRTDDLAGPYVRDTHEAGSRAEKNIAGILDARAYVILTDNQQCGKGMYVELGAALVRASMGDLEDVSIVGPKNHESIFYYHPLLNHFATVDEYLIHLCGLEKRLAIA